jgi:dTMP kinase
MKRGFFITFEGILGSGKSTQISHLDKFLQEMGYRTVVTREPGGTPLSEAIRKTLLYCDEFEMDVLTEFLLFSAARAEHVKEVIKPAVEKGKIVLCDRFADSSRAYQGYGKGVSHDLIEGVTDRAIQGIAPDLTILFDLSVEEGIRRKIGEKDIDRLDKHDSEFHRRIREGYLKMCQADPGRWQLVNAERTPDEIKKSIRDLVLEFLNNKKSGSITIFKTR